MRLNFVTWMAAGLMAAGTAAADRLVVVELYTSQGCSSCPPADEILAEIHEEYDDVLALSFHVDYWDYLGWKDEFARPEFTPRQAAYNEKLESRYRLVTPQMVFDGRSHVAGAKSVSIFQAVAEAQRGTDLAGLEVGIEGDLVAARLTAVEGSEAADVYLVRYGMREDVAIARGENRGRTLDYVNTVSEWVRIGEWDGKSDASFSAAIERGDQAAVIVQVAGSGPVLAARRVDLGDATN